MALLVHSLPQAILSEEIDGALLQDTCPDAFQHMGAGVFFQHHTVNTVLGQDLAQEHARWARANDDDLRFHVFISLSFHVMIVKGARDINGEGQS
jgi:hypothetical protein